MLQPDKRKSDRGKEGKRGGEEERRDCGRTQEKEGKKKRRQREEGRKKRRGPGGREKNERGMLWGFMTDSREVKGGNGRR